MSYDFLEKKINDVVKMMENVYKKDCLVKISIGHDAEKLISGIKVSCIAYVDKRHYPVRFYHKVRNKNDKIDLDVVFSSYESNDNDILIEYQKNRIDVKFYFNDRNIIHEVISKVFIPGLERFKNRPPSNGPLEFTMCIPPDDPNDPNYNKYMNEFEEFKRENPKLVAHLKEQCKGTDLEKFY